MRQTTVIKNVNTKCDRGFLQSASGTTGCDRSLLQCSTKSDKLLL